MKTWRGVKQILNKNNQIICPQLNFGKSTNIDSCFLPLGLKGFRTSCDNIQKIGASTWSLQFLSTLSAPADAEMSTAGSDARAQQGETVASTGRSHTTPGQTHRWSRSAKILGIVWLAVGSLQLSAARTYIENVDVADGSCKRPLLRHVRLAFCTLKWLWPEIFRCKALRHQIKLIFTHFSPASDVKVRGFYWKFTAHHFKSSEYACRIEVGATKNRCFTQRLQGST